MSDSLSSPWIRDYLIDIAETYGAQFFNAPVSNNKKRVQLTDLLTCQEDSYVWAWISDKDYRVSVRISVDAANKYKSDHGRSVIDSRFFLVFISNYRPMFSPRPLGPNVFGNTPISHISLEVSYISSIGIGGHLFGSPRDPESDEKMKEWVSGLRQDGGGGNILMSRKQQDFVQDKNVPPSSRSLPLLQLPPALQDQRLEVAEDVARPRPERPQDLKRAYAKRWRKVEVDPWRFATKPAVGEQPIQTELSCSVVEPLIGLARQLECGEPLVCPTTPHRTPSPALHHQATPTDWSLSNRGSPVALDETNISILGNVIRQHDEPEVLCITPYLPSDAEERTTMDAVVTPDTHSLQPPTPAQRIKCSPIRRSFSPSCSSPEPFTCSSSRPSQQLSVGMMPALPVLQSSKPRLANFIVDFERIDLKGVPIPKLDLAKDIKNILLRTGRIRTLGKEVEKDGSVYIMT